MGLTNWRLKIWKKLKKNIRNFVNWEFIEEDLMLEEDVLPWLDLNWEAIPLAVIRSEIMEDNSFFSSFADFDKKPIEKDDFPRRGLNSRFSKLFYDNFWNFVFEIELVTLFTCSFQNLQSLTIGMSFLSRWPRFLSAKEDWASAIARRACVACKCSRGGDCRVVQSQVGLGPRAIASWRIKLVKFIVGLLARMKWDTS